MKTRRLDAILADTLNGEKDNAVKYTNIKFNEIKELLATDYSQAYDAYRYHDVLIYRGSDSYAHAETRLAVPGNRVSKGLAHVYTKLMSDVLPSWSKYPKRNKSFICSLSSDYAEEFGSVLAVLPKNDTPIAISPTTDIWNAFRDLNELINPDKSFHQLDMLDDTITSIFKYLSDTSEKMITFTTESKSEVIAFFDDLDEKIRAADGVISKYPPLSDEIINNAYEGKSTYDLLAKFLDPDRNGFKIKNITEINSDNDENEVWFSNECMIIDPFYLT